TQIDEFLARGSGAADPNALYAVWAGGNDFLQNVAAFNAGQITAAQLQANVLGAATSEIQQIGRLQAAGARYILVFGLPDIGGTPAAPRGPGRRRAGPRPHPPRSSRRATTRPSSRASPRRGPAPFPWTFSRCSPRSAPTQPPTAPPPPPGSPAARSRRSRRPA